MQLLALRCPKCDKLTAILPNRKLAFRCYWCLLIWDDLYVPFVEIVSDEPKEDVGAGGEGAGGRGEVQQVRQGD